MNYAPIIGMFIGALVCGIIQVLPIAKGRQILLMLGVAATGFTVAYYPTVLAAIQPAPPDPYLTAAPNLPAAVKQCAGYLALLHARADDETIGSWIFVHPECLAALKQKEASEPGESQ